MSSPPDILTENKVNNLILHAMQKHEREAIKRGWIILGGLIVLIVAVKLI